LSANKTNRGTGETAAKTGPRILLYDLETSPNIAYVWGKYEQDALGDFIKERQIISFAWKWLGEKKVNVLALPMLDTYKKAPDNNHGLILKLHALMSEADIVVGHNVVEFDDKMANAEFIAHGLKPPSPHRTIDTLKIARDKFRFNSNKLGDLGKKLGLGAKVHTGGFELWAGCLRGDVKAWAKMMAYNIGDVALLERVYLKLRPWITSGPSIAVLKGTPGCPRCGSKNLIFRGRRLVGGSIKRGFSCKDCGAWPWGIFSKGAWQFR
jgi:hypothetical protein